MDNTTDSDAISIAEPTPVENLELPCPDCDTTLKITTKEELAPDYEVDCPTCGFEDLYVAG